MNQEELVALLKKYEWRDVEFKKAQRGVPDSAYETVSAFANTDGGYLVFGVQDNRGAFELVGVIEVDKVQNDFLSCVRGRNKFNRPISVREDTVEHDSKVLLVFYVPEARHKDKPVFLNGDITKAYIRRGGGDERCSPSEIERFLRDAADTSFDNEILSELDGTIFFDPASLAWYRRIFHEKQGNRHAELTDPEFLNEWGFIVEDAGSMRPTRAAVLLFGKAKFIRHLLPRGMVDYMRIDSPFEEWSPELRWHDRVVAEENLIQTWQILVEKYFRLAERPFSIEASTLRRHDEPPDYISFREAAINLLIHQDFGDHTRKPIIKIFTDRTIFWNPGDAFVNLDKLLDPIEKEVRNPAIVAAFRRIGLSDQAGTGVRSIFGNWRQLGFVPPRIVNDKGEKTFEVTLLRETLLTEKQQLFQARLGVTLSDQEAAVFAYACRSGEIGLTDAKAVIGRGERNALQTLDHLVAQTLLTALESGVRWGLAAHLQAIFMNGDQTASPACNLSTEQVSGPSDKLITAQVSPVAPNLGTAQVNAISPNLITAQAGVLTALTEIQREIVSFCDVPQKLADIMEKTGKVNRRDFKARQIAPLLRAGILVMTNPAKPRASNQQYVITEFGAKLKALYPAAPRTIYGDEHEQE
jgi:ATP-dependent DNA helicase RecG